MSGKALQCVESQGKIGWRDGCLQHAAAPNRNGSRKDHAMATKDLPSPEVLRQLLRYEPETGKLFWRERGTEWFSDGGNGATVSAAMWNRRYAHKEAFTVMPVGYRGGRILGVSTYAHRIAFAIFHGKWPDGEIDHINGNGTDNRIENIRDVTKRENARNMPLRSNNTSGVLGVCWHKRANMWIAQINIGNDSKVLGHFKSFDEACAARAAANQKYGFHPNHGRKTA
jgi:hypothetical protein